MSILGSLFGGSPVDPHNDRDPYGLAEMQKPGHAAYDVYMDQLRNNNALASTQDRASHLAAHQNMLTTGIGITNSSVSSGTRQMNGMAGVRSSDLDNPLFTAPLVALRDMWLVAYGNAWVAEKNMKDDKEWYIIFERLKSAMEHVYLQDKGYAVHRIAPE